MSPIRAKISIRVDLEDDWPDRLNTIRDYLGLKTYTECIRFLIMEKYREIEEKRPNKNNPIKKEI